MEPMTEPLSDPMEQDDYYTEEIAATQETQEPSQPVSSQAERDSNAHLWGYLLPCRESLNRVDFWKMSPEVSFGRSNDNVVQLPSLKISNKHCNIKWDGIEGTASNVTVEDLSTNGTFINGSKVGRWKRSILREGNELSFGSAGRGRDQEDDYRYIFRFLASDKPRNGLHGHYDVGTELGKGTFATVYNAIKRDTGRWYAVKVIQRSRFTPKDAESRDMFMREIAILESLDHPNVCRLEEKFIEENTISLVLEFVNGGDLLEYIILRAGLSEQHSRYLTIQLCEAIAYIHSKGIAHRDLKPENILLTKTDPPVLKVADFGLAKAVSSMTQFKTTCGTPNYLAPEVILRSPGEGYDQVVDSWSIGVIVYAMLTNAVPFQEQSDQDTRTRFESRRIDWQSLYAKNLTNTAVMFVRGLLEEDPRRRLTSEAALNHAWLLPLRVAYEDSLFLNSSASAVVEDGSTMYDEPLYDAPAFDQMDESYRKISMRKLSMVPGAFYSRSENVDVDQGYGSQQALFRRAVEINEQDPEGNMQSWEVVRPDARVDQSEETVTPTSNAEAARDQARAEMKFTDDSDSSLTPVSEDDDGPRAGPSRAVRKGGVTKKRASDGKGKAKTTNAGTAGNSTAPRQTRATGVRNNQERNVDHAMDVEQSAHQTRGVRHSARLASPQKKGVL